jgi:tetratricopeptide (TPR) repeat protein
MLLGHKYASMAESSNNNSDKQQYYSLAITELRKSTEFINDPECYYYLGVCYSAVGNKEYAIPAFKKALELKPDDSHAACDLGQIYFKQTQFDSALPYLLMYNKTDSNNLSVLIYISIAYQHLNKPALALHYDSILFKKSPDKRQALIHIAMTHNDLGVKYAGNKEFDKALEEFNAALYCDSNAVNAIGNIGMVYGQMGNKERAKAYFQKALSKDPNNEVFRREEGLNTKIQR